MLAARMGVVTGKGLAELVREEYGIRWSVLATSAVLVANLGICISDFVGAGAALGLAGVPAQVSVPIVAVGIWLIIVRGSYRSAERIFIWFTIPFFAYPIAAILAHPDWAEVGKAIVRPTLHSSSTYLRAADRDGRHHDHPLHAALPAVGDGRARRARGGAAATRNARRSPGAVFACVIAAFIVIATGATLYTHGVHEIGSAADAARALSPFAGQFAETLFGIGLLGASLLACAILPIATSYVVSESLGYEKGIGRRREEAPVFVGIITAMIVISAIVAVIPGLPVISLLVGVQVVNGLLLPINLFFIWRLSRSARVMGERRSRGLLDAATGLTVVVLSCLSIVLVGVTVARRLALGRALARAAARPRRRLPPARRRACAHQQRGPDRAAEVAERGDVDVRRARVGEQVRQHLLGDPLGRRRARGARRGRRR